MTIFPRKPGMYTTNFHILRIYWTKVCRKCGLIPADFLPRARNPSPHQFYACVRPIRDRICSRQLRLTVTGLSIFSSNDNCIIPFQHVKSPRQCLGQQQKAHGIKPHQCIHYEFKHSVIFDFTLISHRKIYCLPILVRMPIKRLIILSSCLQFISYMHYRYIIYNIIK